MDYPGAMTDIRGFTLIEVLVAGVISVIIPGVIITLLRVNNSELAFNSTQLRLTQISNLVSDDINRYAQRAAYVYSAAEPLAAGKCPATDPILVGPTKGVYFCD